MSNRAAHPEQYYPVFLDLRDRACVVVGGGKVAERKARDLIKAGARLKVVSPALTPGMEKLKAKDAFEHIARNFRKSDLRDALLVIAATGDMALNRRIAREKTLLVNVVDRPELCSFIVPSTLRRGPLAISVSTSGASPAMARAIRKDLEGTYGKAFGEYLGKLKRKRERAAVEISDPGERERFLKSLASEKVLAALRKGRLPRDPEDPGGMRDRARLKK
jgi:precorrin-2 dehydrogenase/sirohydrochlorin ferrochelatase